MARNISMLVADDSSMAQHIVSEAVHLSKLPVRLSTTDNGRDCLTLLNGAHIDLAFIGVQMPELSGVEAVWSARQQGIQTFITLMSMAPAPDAMEVAMRLRAYEYLFKPFTTTDALGIIKTYARTTARTKVLVVDDAPAVRQIVHKVVDGSAFNCEITEAGDGDTAVSLSRTSVFDVVFLDYNMPGLSGIATLKRLLVLQPGLKIVMISSEHSVGAEDEAIDKGACAFLHKPFTSEDVDQVLHVAFGLRTPHLKIDTSEPNFDVAIEGRTIRLAHKSSGHIFEYLWSQTPPFLRNAIVRPAPACAVAATEVAPVAARAALTKLRSAHLVAAA